MNWLNNLRTATKLTLGFGFMVALLAVIMITGLRTLDAVQRSYATAEALTALNGNLNEQRVTLFSMMEASDRAKRESLQQDLRATHDENDRLMQQVRSLESSNQARLTELDRYGAVRADFGQTRDAEIVPLILADKLEEARALTFGVQAQRYVKLRDLSDKLAEEAHQDAIEAAQRAFTTILITGLVALLAAIVIVAFMTRVISRPIAEISRVAERIGSGDLSFELPVASRADEVGVLQSAFHQMLAGLKRLTVELTESINVLTTSATEISASTTQFTASATETATAVGETTTTVEEVRQTAQVSSQKAKAVSETAQKVSQISQTGRKATEEAVEGSGRIREQMDSIAASMVRLSEQSQAIGQIVATVEDLAAQSNLLAVNAAIEAAKAGEHGKGFAVVAQEVKSLAEQSRQATAQVRSILGDIQKATSAAVMATEQGGKAVEAGVKQSTQAGQAIQALTSGVAEATQAASQIAASSQQQLIGVDQVATAMENIKQASSQNVESARQLETAARNLKALGERLKQLVDRYKT